MSQEKAGVYFCRTHFRTLGLRTAGPLDPRPRHWEHAATSHLEVDSFGSDCSSQARAYRVHLYFFPKIIYHVCKVGWEPCMPWHICGGQKTTLLNLVFFFHP